MGMLGELLVVAAINTVAKRHDIARGSAGAVG